MRFRRDDLFTLFLLYPLSAFVAVAAFGCDVRDVPLGNDPGRVSEQFGGSNSGDHDSDVDDSDVRPGATGAVGGGGGAEDGAKGGRDSRDTNEARDAERREDADREDSGTDSATIDSSIQLKICGLTICLPGYVCCESCGICTLPDVFCPQSICWGWIPPQPGFCDPSQCGDSPGMPTVICPDGTMGGPVCTKTEDGTCAWQFRACVLPVSMSCGDSVDLACGPAEYCDAPECGRGSKTGFCQLRPAGCPPTKDPVCGCDGEEYDNQCVARATGTEVDFFGFCR